MVCGCLFSHQDLGGLTSWVPPIAFKILWDEIISKNGFDVYG